MVDRASIAAKTRASGELLLRPAGFHGRIRMPPHQPPSSESPFPWYGLGSRRNAALASLSQYQKLGIPDEPPWSPSSFPYRSGIAYLAIWLSRTRHRLTSASECPCPCLWVNPFALVTSALPGHHLLDEDSTQRDLACEKLADHGTSCPVKNSTRDTGQ